MVGNLAMEELHPHRFSSSSSSSSSCVLQRCLASACSTLRLTSLLLSLSAILLFFLLFQLDLAARFLPQQFAALDGWPRLPASRALRINQTSDSGHASFPPHSSQQHSHDRKTSDRRGIDDPTGDEAASARRPPSLNRVAVCLVGGARAFELTGPSIKKFLLTSHQLRRFNRSDGGHGTISMRSAGAADLLHRHPHEHAAVDVFLHAPLDQDVYKLSILSDVPNLVRIRIFKPQPLPERQTAAEVLTSSNSPHGIQGLLQYFNLVEGCATMIREHQLQHAFVYDWIIRTRLYGYWNDHIAVPLHIMDPGLYTAPEGSHFGGLNDRLGIGNWATSEVALSRISLLPTLHGHGLRGLNSETFFKQQLQVCNISYSVREFPFCVLSHRTYGWPPGTWGVPVLSIASKGPLNGAKCRPCTPVALGTTARTILEASEKSWAWVGRPQAPELCDPTSDWEVGWQDLFDQSVADPVFAQARRDMSNQTHAQCIEAIEALRKKVQIWDAQSSHEICHEGFKMAKA